MRHLLVAILVSVLLMGMVIAIPIVTAILSAVFTFFVILLVAWFVIKVLTHDDSR